MAIFLDPSGILPGFPVESIQVKQLYDALTPKTIPGHSGVDYNIYVNGMLSVEGGADITGNVSATSFQGSGALLSDVVLTSYLPILTTEATFTSFSSSYYVDSASFDTRIKSNVASLVNFDVASASFESKRKVLQNEVNLLSSSFETASGSLELRITNVSASLETTINVVSESLESTISLVSQSFETTIDSVSGSLAATIDTVSSSAAGDIATLDTRVDALELEDGVHDVFMTGSCNTAILPTNGTGNSITGNNIDTFLAGTSNTTVTATQGLANAVIAARNGKICGTLVSDSAILASSTSCVQGTINNSAILGGNSNLIGGTLTGGGKASNSTIVGSVGSKIGSAGSLSCVPPNANVILGGQLNVIESCFPLGCAGIAYSAIVGGQGHSIGCSNVTSNVLHSVIMGGCNSTVTTSETIVLGSGLTGNLANHTFVEGLNVKDNATVGGNVTVTGDVTGANIIGDGSQLTNVRYEESFTPATSVTVTHNLNLDTPIVQVWSASGVQVIPSEVTRVSSNELNVTFAFATTGSVVVAR